MARGRDAEARGEGGRAGETRPARAGLPSPDHAGSIVEPFLLRMAHADRAPKLLIDEAGKVLWHSPDAERLLQPPMPLRIEGGRLCAALPRNAASWAAFLAGLDESGSRLLLTGKSAATWVLVSGWAEQTAGRRMIFLKCAMSWPLRDAADSGLADDFGLTRAECAVLDEFARLHKPAQIAERLAISVSTVRSHLKQIHAKMAVSSNVHLLRITRAYCDS